MFPDQYFPFSVRGSASPAVQPPVLVIDENTAIAHRWRALDYGLPRQGDSIAMLRLQIIPPDPQRNTDAARNRKEAIGCTATIGSGDHHGPVKSQKRIPDVCHLIGFALTKNWIHVELAGGPQGIDQDRLADRADNQHRHAFWLGRRH